MEATMILRKSDRFEIDGTMYRVGAVATITTVTFGAAKHLKLVAVDNDAVTVLMSMSRIKQAIADGTIIQHAKSIA